MHLPGCLEVCLFWSLSDQSGELGQGLQERDVDRRMDSSGGVVQLLSLGTKEASIASEPRSNDHMVLHVLQVRKSDPTTSRVCYIVRHRGISHDSCSDEQRSRRHVASNWVLLSCCKC